MQVTAEDELAELFCACLPELDEIEAALVQDCWLREPKVPLTEFSKQWHLSGKALTELRSGVLVRMRRLLATRGVKSVADIC
jgi:hypothetical protein